MFELFLQANPNTPIAFNAIDIFIFVIFCLGAYRGFQKGFLVEFISSFAFIIAIILAFKALEAGFVLGKDFLKGSKAAPFISFILMFLVIGFLINLIGKKLKRVIRYTLFEGLDSFLGGVLGLFKYIIGLSLFFKLLEYVGLDTAPGYYDLNSTFFFPKLISFFDFSVQIISRFMPDFGAMFESIKKLLSGTY